MSELDLPDLPDVPVLEVRDLRVSYRSRHASVAAVRGVSFSVPAGEVVAMVGESGSGKSTVALSTMGMLPANGHIDGGQVLLRGVDVSGLSDRRWRAIRGREIGLIPQDPTVTLDPVQRVGRQVAEVLKIHGLAARRFAELRAVELLGRAGLPDPENRARAYPHQLSGGMRQRVLIAIALAAEPGLLVADEPTSALDVTVQRQILDHLEQLRREARMAMLLVTHDLGVAADRSQHLVVMSRGEVVEQGPTQEVLGAPQHPYTQRLLAAAPSLARPGRRSRPSRAEVAGGAGLAVLDLEGLTKTFVVGYGPRRTTVRAVDDVSLTVRAGETVGLVGESGSGKSTLARLAVRLARPDAGTVTLLGRDITAARGENLRAIRRNVQLVYQNPYASLNPKLTIQRIVEEPLRSFGIGDRVSRRRQVETLLDGVALPASVLARRPSELSGGQRQRVAIARALALEPDLLVCDEPVSALDVSVQAQILELLGDLQQRLGIALLFISHDLAVVREISDRVAVMKDGRLVECAATTRIFTAPSHPYTGELLAAIPGSASTQI